MCTFFSSFVMSSLIPNIWDDPYVFTSWNHHTLLLVVQFTKHAGSQEFSPRCNFYWERPTFGCWSMSWSTAQNGIVCKLENNQSDVCESNDTIWPTKNDVQIFMANVFVGFIWFNQHFDHYKDELLFQPVGGSNSLVTGSTPLIACWKNLPFWVVSFTHVNHGNSKLLHVVTVVSWGFSGNVLRKNRPKTSRSRSCDSSALRLRSSPLDRCHTGHKNSKICRFWGCFGWVWLVKHFEKWRSEPLLWDPVEQYMEEPSQIGDSHPFHPQKRMRRHVVSRHAGYVFVHLDWSEISTDKRQPVHRTIPMKPAICTLAALAESSFSDSKSCGSFSPSEYPWGVWKHRDTSLWSWVLLSLT